jgi:hypothetical protein
MLFGATQCKVRITIWDREVGGSNPLAPTSQINNLRLPVVAAVFLVWPICGHFVQVHLSLQLNGPNVPDCGLQILTAHQHHYRERFVSS